MIKNRIVLTCIGLFAILACGVSRTIGPVVSDTGQDSTRLENALLWRISRADIASESYLFGTIHIIGADQYFLPAGTDYVMEMADRFVFEIDMADMMDLGAQFTLLTKAFMTDGTRIKDLVSAEDYNIIEAHFAGMGLPMMLLDRIKPLFLTVFASPEVDPQSLSSGEMTSYEMEFFEYARSHDKKTGGLETMEFQLSVFDSIPYPAQAEMLVESLRSVEGENDVFQDMIDLYLAQDIESLYAAIGDDTTGAGPYEDVLVKNRNRRWIGGIETYMQEGSVFFAVCAGHLAGSDGVIRLLRDAGFTVTPVLQMAESSREIKRF